MIERLESSLFDWLAWRNGSPADVFGIPCRRAELTSLPGKALLRKHAIGYCPGESTPCRPRPGHMGVMFWKNNRTSWFHMREDEFREIFGAL